VTNEPQAPPPWGPSHPDWAKLIRWNGVEIDPSEIARRKRLAAQVRREEARQAERKQQS
jgi:hypothetical protein